ncbi:MAG: aminoacyltransferase, partial [Actinomycetes bacterium]|nr:aminoacyltransferase [Actinomycetes bacterium]
MTVRTITPEQHLDFIRRQRSASFLQTPAWAKVKSEWRAESLGWFDGGEEPVGAALVLYRQLPKVRRYLAYIPEGPLIDWASGELGDWLAPMTKHLADEGAFGVRMGPPVVTRTWDAAAVKKGVAEEGIKRLTEIAPAE